MFISKVIKDIIEIRRVLRDNNHNTKVFGNNWKIETSAEKKGLEGYMDEKWKEFKTLRGGIFGKVKPLLPSKKNRRRIIYRKKMYRIMLFLMIFIQN